MSFRLVSRLDWFFKCGFTLVYVKLVKSRCIFILFFSMYIINEYIVITIGDKL